MTRTYHITAAIFTHALGLAGTMALIPAALAQEAAADAITVDAPHMSVPDARSAILSAIALGYTEIQRAGLVGDYYEIDAIDSSGDRVRLFMDPETGVFIKIKKDM